jgi:hypothetical protein
MTWPRCGPVEIEDGDVGARAWLEPAEIGAAQRIGPADGGGVVIILAAHGATLPAMVRARIMPTCRFMIMSGGLVSVPMASFRPISR